MGVTSRVIIPTIKMVDRARFELATPTNLDITPERNKCQGGDLT
jgi:hypothetical protein